MDRKGDRIMKGYEKLEQRLMHQGKVVGFYEDIVKLPSGKVVTWDLVKHKGAAAVVPVTDKGTILLVRQYRNALDQETLEIPAGGIEPAPSRRYFSANLFIYFYRYLFFYFYRFLVISCK